MYTIFIKYVGNRKGGLYTQYKDWVKVGKADSERQATEMLNKFRRNWKGFEFKFE